jgi:hypothetical protein
MLEIPALYPAHEMVYKNTFVEMVDPDAASGGELRRSKSDSDISSSSKSSERRLLNSIWSPLSANGSSRCSASQDGSHGAQTPRAGAQTPKEGYDRVQGLLEDLAHWRINNGKHDESKLNIPQHVQGSILTTGAPASAVLQPQDLLEALQKELGVPLEQLEILMEDDLLHQIPRSDEGHLLSVGSIKHGTEVKCKPCVFWHKGDCKIGTCCNYCHFSHVRKSKRKKPSKNTRRRLQRKYASEGEDDADSGEEDGAEDGLPPSGQNAQCTILSL